jgi:hypothetical protein
VVESSTVVVVVSGPLDGAVVEPVTVVSVDTVCFPLLPPQPATTNARHAVTIRAIRTRSSSHL